ncbi:MAG: hypothetical protein IJW13_06225 [Clostridia bacterium]|nr:hypothetical protein [Clostridia bacterium]
MNTNIVFLGLLLLLASNGTISATQAFLLLALLASTSTLAQACQCTEQTCCNN